MICCNHVQNQTEEVIKVKKKKSKDLPDQNLTLGWHLIPLFAPRHNMSSNKFIIMFNLDTSWLFSGNSLPVPDPSRTRGASCWDSINFREVILTCSEGSLRDKMDSYHTRNIFLHSVFIAFLYCTHIVQASAWRTALSSWLSRENLKTHLYLEHSYSDAVWLYLVNIWWIIR